MFRRKSLLAYVHRNTKRFVSTKPSCVEVRIPVPWGHIAGKWWGPTDQRPILTMHGWQDNCGSFDLLIPKLPRNQSYLVIDFPGHGLSSKLPPGFFYYNIDGAILVKRLKHYFKWDKVSLMGHSLGAVIAYTYGFLFPSTVEFAICIDAFHTLVNKKDIDKYVSAIEDFVKLDAQNSSGVEPPSFSFEELAVKLNKGTFNSISVEKVKYILKRNVKPSRINPGKFYINRDVRLKCGPLLLWSEEEVIEAAGRVNFPLFMSKAAVSPFFKEKHCFPQIYAVLKQSCPDFEFHQVQGTHHGHLNNPEIYEEILPGFINRFAGHDRSQVDIIDEIRVGL